MAKGGNVLTTGDVAKICNVAPRTVSKWFDNGQLKGYRIPGSKDRRIPLSELVCFMKEHDMPTALLSLGRLRLLIADSNAQAALNLADTLTVRASYEVQTVSNNFETGLMAQKFAPHILLINLDAAGLDAAEICRTIRSDKQLRAIKIIAITERSNGQQTDFDGWLNKQADISEITKKIEELTTVII